MAASGEMGELRFAGLTKRWFDEGADTADYRADSLPVQDFACQHAGGKGPRCRALSFNPARAARR
jgi:hypothetical protein